MKSGFAAYNSQ